MRVAFFSPLPPSPSGVADYSRLLLDGLAAKFPIEAYTSGAIDSTIGVPCYSWKEFEQRQTAEPRAIPVYQIGNSLHHDFIYSIAFRHAGVVVLHDLVLHHSRLAMYMKSPEVVEYRADMGNTTKRDRAMDKLSEYTSEVEASYPLEGSEVAEIAIRMGGGRLLYEYPLHELLVKANKMVLVHSAAARDKLLESCPESNVRVVRMGIAAPGRGQQSPPASFDFIALRSLYSIAFRHAGVVVSAAISCVHASSLICCGKSVMVTDQVQALDFPDAVLPGHEDGLFCELLVEVADDAREYSEAS